MSQPSVFEEQFVKPNQLVQKGSLILMALIASLMFAFRRHNGILMAAILALICLVAPAAYLIARRLQDKVQQRETEDRLMSHTRAYLQREEPLRYPPASGDGESEIEILARSVDGRKLPLQDFRMSGAAIAMPPIADAIIFDALPRQYATQRVCDRRFHNLAAQMPKPVSVRLTAV